MEKGKMLCNECEHQPVCKYSSTCEELMGRLAKLDFDRECTGIFSAELKCTNYLGKIPNNPQLTGLTEYAKNIGKLIESYYYTTPCYDTPCTNVTDTDTALCVNKVNFKDDLDD